MNRHNIATIVKSVKFSVVGHTMRSLTLSTGLTLRLHQPQFAQFLTVKTAVGWRLQHKNLPPHIPTFLAPCSKLYGRPPSLIYSNALTTTTALRSPCAAIFRNGIDITKL